MIMLIKSMNSCAKDLKIKENSINNCDFFIIVIIPNEFGLDRPVSPSSNSLFKGLPKSSSSIWSTIQSYFCHPVAVRSCYMS